MILFFWLLVWPLLAQNDRKELLEKQKKENLAKIKELNAIINRTASKKKASMGKLNVLNQQITVQKKQITILNEHQKALEQEAQKLTRESDLLAAKLKRLKRAYAIMLYEAQKTATVYNKLTFLLLSDSFKDFYKRYDYLRQFSNNRKAQAQKIFKTRQDLMTKKQQVVFKKQEEKKVLTEKEKEKKSLEVLKDKKSVEVKLLTQQEKKLRQELEKRKLANQKLNGLIATLVQREIEKSIERERKARIAREAKQLEVKKPTLPNIKSEGLAIREAPKVEGKPNVEKPEKEPSPEPSKPAPAKAAPLERNVYYMNAEEAKLASSFGALKGRMPLPVPSGFISDRFGVHQHPLLKGVMINNNGVDIQTNAGAAVHAVYDGEVKTVVNVPGINMMVAIQHGEYFTVYSKLANVSVSPGQKVRTGQRIGSVASDEDGTAEINFQVWRNTVKQNPESWLRR